MAVGCMGPHRSEHNSERDRFRRRCNCRLLCRHIFRLRRPEHDHHGHVCGDCDSPTRPGLRPAHRSRARSGVGSGAALLRLQVPSLFPGHRLTRRRSTCRHGAASRRSARLAGVLPGAADAPGCPERRLLRRSELSSRAWMATCLTGMSATSSTATTCGPPGFWARRCRRCPTSRLTSAGCAERTGSHLP